MLPNYLYITADESKLDIRARIFTCVQVMYTRDQKHLFNIMNVQIQIFFRIWGRIHLTEMTDFQSGVCSRTVELCGFTLVNLNYSMFITKNRNEIN